MESLKVGTTFRGCLKRKDFRIKYFHMWRLSNTLFIPHVALYVCTYIKKNHNYVGV